MHGPLDCEVDEIGESYAAEGEDDTVPVNRAIVQIRSQNGGQEKQRDNNLRRSKCVPGHGNQLSGYRAGF